jgi:hypothetical protein
MSPEQARIALIDSIYEAVLDNDRWPSVLESIADAIGTVQVAVASTDQQANIVAVIAPRIDPELVASWRDYWAFRDPFGRAILRPSGEIYTLDNLISREEFAATPVFSAVWRPANCSLATAATNLVVKDKFCALIGVSNAPGGFLDRRAIAPLRSHYAACGTGCAHKPSASETGSREPCSAGAI